MSGRGVGAHGRGEAKYGSGDRDCREAEHEFGDFGSLSFHGDFRLLDWVVYPAMRSSWRERAKKIWGRRSIVEALNVANRSQRAEGRGHNSKPARISRIAANLIRENSRRNRRKVTEIFRQSAERVADQGIGFV